MSVNFLNKKVGKRMKTKEYYSSLISDLAKDSELDYSTMSQENMYAKLIHTTNKNLQKHQGMQGYLFINENAQLISLSDEKLHTSRIIRTEKIDDEIILHTKNSIYTFWIKDSEK